jgi:Mlc titration factor MtfA (ptsG expression regulator)
MAKRRHLADDWVQIVRQRVAYWNLFTAPERERQGELAEHLVSTKRWEAAKDFALTDEIVMTIAAQAAVLVLGLDTTYFGKVTTIIVHPSSFAIPGPRASAIRGMIADGSPPLHGEAHHDRGPVLLSWDQARFSARHRGRGHNVVLHEFAHKVDMLDGVVDGTPILPDRVTLDRWVEVCAAELDSMRSGDTDSFLDEYAATDPGEFVAVATEAFFDRPIDLRAAKPELYDVLVGFYRQDTAAREELVRR